MVDHVSSEKRSQIMSAIRGKNTKPEYTVRRLLYAAGYRYRLHIKNLPGKPDIVLKKHKIAIFVHGCYWHRHKKCQKGKSCPASNTAFWEEKFLKTIQRDKKNIKLIRRMGWKPIIIWECETKLKEKILMIVNKAKQN